MLCEKCGKENATTHIRTVINGKVIEKHLCAHCAANDGYTVSGNNISQILSSMLGNSSATAAKPQVTHCSCCGSTFSDISESGKCGCPECYNVFYGQLLPYFKRIHGNINHIGKTPHNTSATNQLKDTVDELRRLLTQLVSEERYEDAAVVRDKIKILEGEAL